MSSAACRNNILPLSILKIKVAQNIGPALSFWLINVIEIQADYRWAEEHVLLSPYIFCSTSSYLSIIHKCLSSTQSVGGWDHAIVNVYEQFPMLSLCLSRLPPAIKKHAVWWAGISWFLILCESVLPYAVCLLEETVHSPQLYTVFRWNMEGKSSLSEGELESEFQNVKMPD